MRIIPKGMVAVAHTAALDKLPASKHVKQAEENPFKKALLTKIRQPLWNVLEHPSSGIVAKVFAGLSMSVIILSVALLVLGSMSSFKIVHVDPVDNTTQSEPIPSFIKIEYGCVIWFTIEYFLRLFASPDTLSFLKGIIRKLYMVNIVDALSVFPFYIEFALQRFGIEFLSNIKGALLAMKILRVLRVARVFKLARYHSGLQSFIRTCGSSRKEMGMLILFLSTGVLLFSTTVYFMEKDAPNTPFESIPHTFWWAVVTMTTVGYGDMIPVTPGGKLVASFATICGVVVLAFPISMIVENFCRHYQWDVYQIPPPLVNPQYQSPSRIKHSVAII